MANASDKSFRRGHYKIVSYIFPGSKKLMNRMQDLLLKETSYHIDLLSCDGGTSSTGNVDRVVLAIIINKRDFLRWTTSAITPEDKKSS